MRSNRNNAARGCRKEGRKVGKKGPHTRKRRSLPHEGGGSKTRARCLVPRLIYAFLPISTALHAPGALLDPPPLFPGPALAPRAINHRGAVAARVSPVICAPAGGFTDSSPLLHVLHDHATFRRTFSNWVTSRNSLSLSPARESITFLSACDCFDFFFFLLSLASAGRRLRVERRVPDPFLKIKFRDETAFFKVFSTSRY